MVSTSNTKDTTDDFQLTDDESGDITYEMSVEGSDNDSDLFDYVDNETEETKIDDNEEDHEVINVDDIVANVDDDNNDVENAYHVHDPKQKWKLMKPSLGEKYENPTQLKFCVTNYAIANGYQLRFDKCDSKRVVVRCGLKRDGENQCPFRLYASWINKERTFQVKILDDNHTCPRNYAHNSLAKPDWIAQALLPNLIKNQDMTLKEMKKYIFEKYLCNVSLGQCHRGKGRAIHRIEGSLAEHCGRVLEAVERKSTEKGEKT
ncbi:hypothetical protein OSB04_007224 [Centaurea solstitialis]|uniref:Transposase MuDR plant domain-containing protein n=1 Tax=Centaurea solstitialis TaxID=347529 RepID=A0AA38TJH4_9ASTR|nr:hypothetical protein OSB04_007224 [Centaurea solstitialis]